MAFITKKHLPRRTFLRGVGATIALPLLDSMVAAQTPIRKTAAAAKSRLSCIYVPHGATMDKWTPAATGKGFEFTETLSPLEKLRDRVTIVSNLAHAKAGAVGSDAGADHARSAAVFLSGAQPARDSIQVGETIDQIAARQIGQESRDVALQARAALRTPEQRRERGEEVGDLRLRDAVGRQQLLHIRYAQPHLGLLHPTDRQRGYLDDPRGVLVGDSGRFPQCLQALAEDHPQDSGCTAARAVVAHVLTSRSGVTASSVPCER